MEICRSVERFNRLSIHKSHQFIEVKAIVLYAFKRSPFQYSSRSDLCFGGCYLVTYILIHGFCNAQTNN